LLVVELHQHATEPHVDDYRITSPPTTVGVPVESACAARSMPPATHRPALDIDTDVVVDVFSTEHHPVSGPERPCCPRHRITGVSAVPGHRQPVLTYLSKYDSY